MKKLFLCTVISSLVVGCSTPTRPSDDLIYQSSVNKAVNNEKIKINERAFWYPNQSRINARPFLVQPMTEGNLTITEKGIYFMEWDENSNEFNVTFSKNICDISSVKIDSYGFHNRVSIKSETWDGFSIYNGFKIDTDKTKAMFDYLKSIPCTANK